jgi:hypothetical protein
VPNEETCRNADTINFYYMVFISLVSPLLLWLRLPGARTLCCWGWSGDTPDTCPCRLLCKKVSANSARARISMNQRPDHLTEREKPSPHRAFVSPPGAFRYLFCAASR